MVCYACTNGAGIHRPFTLFATHTTVTTPAGGRTVKRTFFELLALCLLVSATISAQDIGAPDSVNINPSTLFLGRSYPVKVAIVNDKALKSFNLGLISRSLDTGFAKLDSIRYAGRMTPDTVLNLRLSGFREENGVSPDTSILTAFWAGPSAGKLGPGNDHVVEIFMTGTRLGSMTLDSGFMPPGGNFVLIPWDTNFTATGFSPRYHSSVVKIAPVRYVCGNVDDDLGGNIDIADITALIDYLYVSLVPPAGITQANIDDSTDRSVDISDLTALIGYLFLGGSKPTCFTI